MYKAPIKNATLFEQPVPYEHVPGEPAPKVPTTIQPTTNKPPGGYVVIDPSDLTNEQYVKILLKVLAIQRLY